MTDTLLITLAKPDPERLDTFHAYVGASTQLALDAGGAVSSRFAVRHLHGDAPATTFGFATFPSAEAIADMFAGPDYLALIPGRDESVEGVNAYIVDEPALTELDDPAEGGVYLVVVAAPSPDAPDDLATYRDASGPLFAKHGAQPVTQFPVTGHPVGETPAAFVAILAFPSAEAVDAIFADPAYLAIVDVRDRAMATLDIYVTTG